ncbi:putative uncharacterized protein DDB_G0277255 [Penaeus japonicus]|uniref:putative uncharacterized protein DDB_G0277255 n=1 Tax=Penaeus japonicus TaxID=27405 RepID=UPI001C70D999|nr:putative uncharacterized protein DDB_G0277255 [Penaeus japonicus]
MMVKTALVLAVCTLAAAAPQRSTVEAFKTISLPHSHADAHAEAKEAFRNSDTFSALDDAGAQFFQMLGSFASSLSKIVTDSMERARQSTTSRASFSSSSLPSSSSSSSSLTFSSSPQDTGSSGNSGFTVVKSFNKKIIPQSSHN